MEHEIKETNGEGKETGTKSMIWKKRKKETFNQNRMKKQ